MKYKNLSGETVPVTDTLTEEEKKIQQLEQDNAELAAKNEELQSRLSDVELVLTDILLNA
ncbi:hypothetical protein [Paenibacillus sp. MMO-58]|uniref:hypothetical protein n=1 Tax=Paenibacillus sp. MMO-58 TaxID=3081290 RepID=UPI00301635DE